ncbi:MAG: T9SS-dependent M36 family metallopeptidase [Bacteroidota bacterium]
MKRTLHRALALLGLIAINSAVFSQTILQESAYGGAIIEHLENNKQKYNITSEDLNSLLISNAFYSSHSDLTFVYLNQAYQNIKIYNAISTVALRDGKVYNFSNRFIKDIDQKVNATSPDYTPENAIYKVAEHYQLGTVQELEVLTEDQNTVWYSNGNISGNNIKVERMFYLIENSLKLVWDVTVYTLDRAHWWNVKVDASTNDILNADDYILTCSFGHDHIHNHSTFSQQNEQVPTPFVLVDNSSYNVFALPTESPNHGPRQIVTEPASTLASPFGWHDVDGVRGPDFFITQGNNVLAQEDRNGDNGTGFSPNGTAALNFDFDLDFNQPPAGYQDAAITNLFYTNNMMHDIWYHHGFDEVSGNFQANNYGNGGIGNDYVLADAQDGSGLNNATFGTPPDGFNPVMTMFLWSAPGPPGEPITINNGSLAGNYTAVQAGFGEALSTTPITADMALFIDSNSGGESTDLFDACDAVVNGAQLAGKIVVIRRGSCEFGTKVFSAEQEGAVAVIMVNNVPDAPIAMAAGTVGNLVTIPSMMVNQTDGEAIIAALVNGETINATLVNNGPFQVDGDFDNGIIAHEYGHGISTRLTGGSANAGCLFNAEQMGEGWSDWFALMVTMNTTDTANDARGIGTFAIGQNTDGQGIRPSRYSPDFGENSFTYGDTNNPGLSVPHGVGFVWATVLWDLTWAYIDKYGFDPDLYNGDGGNNRVILLVTEALKLQPCSPGFVDGRNALLGADFAITGGADQCMIWEIFAARGLGVGASQGDSGSRTDQVESFTMPPPSDPSLANCTALSVDEFNASDVSIYPNPTNDQVFINTKTGLGEVKITIVDLNGRIVLEMNRNLNSELQFSVANLQSGVYILTISSDTIDYNQKLIKN